MSPLMFSTNKKPHKGSFGQKMIHRKTPSIPGVHAVPMFVPSFWGVLDKASISYELSAFDEMDGFEDPRKSRIQESG